MIRLAKAFLRSTRSTLSVAAVAGLFPLAGFSVQAPVSEGPPALGELPLYFEAGSVEGGFKYFARGRSSSFLVAPTEAVLTLSKVERSGEARFDDALPPQTQRTATRELRLELLGGNPTARLGGAALLPGVANYFLGSDAASWRTGVPLYGQVRVEQIYPGVDLVYYGNARRLEYDFVVAPGADPRNIAIQFSGADALRVDAAGDLIFTFGNEEIRQPKPIIYQVVNGSRAVVIGGYQLKGNIVRFELGKYQRDLPLVIDPVLSYGTYFGGSGADAAWDIGMDGEGSIYMAGESMGGLPTRANTITNQFNGGARERGDAFVAKFDATGTNLLYLAYIGGRGQDAALSLAVDTAGNAFLSGFTDSTNFPVVQALFPSITGKRYPTLDYFPPDAFVTKLGPTGTNIVYSTYLGGEWLDAGRSITVDAVGNAYVVGYTTSTNFSTRNVEPALTNLNGGTDAFVAKIDPSGTNLIYSFYLGGTNEDIAWDVAARADGTAYVTGSTRSTNFTARANAPGGGMDVFLTEVGTAAQLAVTNLSSLYFGGTRDNEAYRLLLDANNNLFLAGTTLDDLAFPVTPSTLNPGGAFQTTNGGSNWVQTSSGLTSVAMTSLAIDPANPLRLFAGTRRGVARSLDGGATWTMTTTTNRNGAGFASAITQGSVLSVALVGANKALAGTILEGVLLSPDNGHTWLTTTGWVNQSVAALAPAPSQPLTIYAGSDAGVYKSTDGGTNWTAFNNGLGNLVVQALVVSPTNALIAYAATVGGVYLTSDGGTNWASVNSGLANLAAQALVMHPINPAILFVGTAGGVFQTTNGAGLWQVINAGFTVSNVTALAIDPVTPTTIYAGTTNGLFKRVSGSVQWTNHSQGLIVRHVLALAIPASAPATLYAGTRGAAFQGSNDVFVAKLNATTHAVSYSAVWGGSGSDKPGDVAVDGGGRVFVTGRTISTNYPTIATVGFFRRTNSGGQDAFISQLRDDGQYLEESAYFGGSGTDGGYGIALTAQGESFIVGSTGSTDFPTAHGMQTNFAGSTDAFLIKAMGQGLPILSITPQIAAVTNQNQVVLSWSTNWPNFLLEGVRATDLLNPPVWTFLARSTSSFVVVTNGEFRVTYNDGVIGTNAFFRLRRE
jgi:hypothetical protein